MLQSSAKEMGDRGSAQIRPAVWLALCCLSMILHGSAAGQVLPRRTAAAFSTDGTLGAFSRPGQLVLVDTSNWNKKWNIDSRIDERIDALAFSRDGRRLASAGANLVGAYPASQKPSPGVTVKVLDTSTGRTEDSRVYEQAQMIQDLSFTSDGSLLAVILRANNELLLWDVTRDQTISLARKPRIAYCTAVFAPSGDKLAFAIVSPGRPYPEFEIRLFDNVMRSVTGMVTRGVAQIREIPLAFSPDETSLVFAIESWNINDDKPTEIRLFDLVSRKATCEIKTGALSAYSLIFSPDGKSILGTGLDFVRTGSRDAYLAPRVGRVLQWDAATEKLQRAFGQEYGPNQLPDPFVRSMRVPRRDLYAFISSAGNVYFYDWNSMSPSAAATSPFPEVHISARPPSNVRDKEHMVSAQRILALSFGINNRILAGNSTGSLGFFLPSGGARPSQSLQLDPETEMIAISPDTRAVAAARGPDIAIVNMVSGAKERELPAGSGSVRAMAYAPNGEWFAAASSDGTIRIWSTKDWQQRARLTGHQGAVAALAFSRDGTVLASGGEDRIIRIWDVQSGPLARTLTGHKGSVNALAFGARADILASTSAEDSSVMLWQLSKGADPQRLRGHAGAMRSLAFSPDGARLAGAGDETICVWDSASGKLDRIVGEVEVEGRRPKFVNIWRCDAVMTIVAYSPDGAFLAAGGFNNSLFLWQTASWKISALFQIPAESPGTSAQKYSAQIEKLETQSEKPNATASAGFSGTWVLNAAKSVIVRLTAPAASEIILKMSDQGMTIITPAAPEPVRELTYILDGSEHTIPVANTVRKYKANRDGNVITIVEWIPAPQSAGESGARSIERKFVLAADGNVLTILYKGPGYETLGISHVYNRF